MCVCSIHMCLVKGPGPPWQPPYWNWALKTTSEWSAKGNSKAPPPGPLTPNGYCNRHAMVTVGPHGQTSDCEIPAPTQNSGRNNLMVTAHLDCSMLLRVTECLKPRWHFANAPSLYARRMTTAKTVHRRTIAWKHRPCANWRHCPIGQFGLFGKNFGTRYRCAGPYDTSYSYS